MKSLIKNVALVVSLLALTTPSEGQSFLKKVKDAANNATEKVNTAVENQVPQHRQVLLCPKLPALPIMCPEAVPTRTTDSVRLRH